MTYLTGYQTLITQLSQRLDVPGIRQILLPEINQSDDIKDNFGFVILEDGSAGPFYTCFGNTLEWLHHHHTAFSGEAATSVAARLDGVDIPLSSLALGSFNALSQNIMTKAGFDPTTIEKRSDTDFTAKHIGMVGFFRPLIERYLNQGKRVTVIEKQPERVPDDLDLDLHTSPEGLATCDYILCTASTLINNTLESIIQGAGDPAKINLIGPSASGLPDLLFDLGIHSTGGFFVDDLEALTQAVSQGESWGNAGRKYQLTQSTYPGLDSLLEMINQ
ncbi:MAG: DUF364 domain-containing protein [Sedimenticola sp.]|nr:DUF364 domain-containing protein [Sedimenticola sp.]